MARKSCRPGWLDLVDGARTGVVWVLAASLIVALIAVVFKPLTPAYDLDVFLRAGHHVLSEEKLYPAVGSQAVYSGSSFVYPYFAVWPFVPLALLTHGVGMWLFFCLSSAAVIAASLLAAEGDPLPAVLVLAAAFTITGLQLGALSPLLFAGVLLMWRLRDRPLPFALIAGPVVASKLFLLPLLAWPLLARRYRAFLGAAAASTVLLGIGFILGPLGVPAFVRMLSALGSHEARSGFGLTGALMNLGAPAALAQIGAFGSAIVVVGAAYLYSRRARDERVLFGAGILASLLASPVVWSHYYVLVAAVLLVLGAPRRWLAVFTLASWAIAPPHGIHLNTALLAGVPSSGTWMVVIAFTLALVYHPGRGHARSPT